MFFCTHICCVCLAFRNRNLGFLLILSITLGIYFIVNRQHYLLFYLIKFLIYYILKVNFYLKKKLRHETIN